MLVTGEVPWRTANVVPLFKKANRVRPAINVSAGELFKKILTERIKYTSATAGINEKSSGLLY